VPGNSKGRACTPKGTFRESKKALYGLKQAPRAWYGRIDSFLQSLGFTKSIADPNLYIKIVQNHPVILVLYVDDMFLTERKI
jgi:hypothetical protein